MVFCMEKNNGMYIKNIESLKKVVAKNVAEPDMHI